jgi:hypothetical protein
MKISSGRKKATHRNSTPFHESSFIRGAGGGTFVEQFN